MDIVIISPSNHLEWKNRVSMIASYVSIFLTPCSVRSQTAASVRIAFHETGLQLFGKVVYGFVQVLR